MLLTFTTLTCFLSRARASSDSARSAGDRSLFLANAICFSKSSTQESSNVGHFTFFSCVFKSLVI